MNSLILGVLIPFLLLTTSAFAQVTAAKPSSDPPEPEADPQEIAARLTKSSEDLAEIQDELSADVMELVESQTDAGVIKLLEEVEVIMAEVTDDLVEGVTGGATMAAETEIIEKILAAAKQKQQSSGEGSKEGSGAMLDMMERMTGKEPGDQPGPPSEGGDKPGESAAGGGGSDGDSDTANGEVNGESEQEELERRIPKGSAPSGRRLPNEFQKRLDAYNQNQPANK